MHCQEWSSIWLLISQDKPIIPMINCLMWCEIYTCIKTIDNSSNESGIKFIISPSSALPVTSHAFTCVCGDTRAVSSFVFSLFPGPRESRKEQIIAQCHRDQNRRIRRILRRTVLDMTMTNLCAPRPSLLLWMAGSPWFMTSLSQGYGSGDTLPPGWPGSGVGAGVGEGQGWMQHKNTCIQPDTWGSFGEFCC